MQLISVLVGIVIGTVCAPITGPIVKSAYGWVVGLIRKYTG